MERQIAWNNYDAKELKKVQAFNEDYKAFLSKCKTERECVTEMIDMAEKNGYTNLQKAIEKGEKLKAGDKVYVNQMGKALVMFHIGKEPL